MEAVASVSRVRSVQGALRVLAALHLTATLMPQTQQPQDKQGFDYIIVGGGTAGCVLANRLTEDERSHVLLIEAGGDPPLQSAVPGLMEYLPSSPVDWNYTSTNDGYSSQCRARGEEPMVRGRMLGGSSGLNFMLYVRGNPRDYHQWAAAAGHSHWDWEHVYPYFLKGERLADAEILNSSDRTFYGTEGYLGLSKGTSEVNDKLLSAFKELGHEILLDINANNTVGYNSPLFTIADGVRQSTAFAYLSPVKERPNLHVLKGSLVTKIIFDDNKRAVGVEVITDTNKTTSIRARKEVILSAGALNSPQLLMLSGIGPAEQLRHHGIDILVDLPFVGSNLQDHLSIVLFHKMGNLEPLKPVNPKMFPAPIVHGYVALNKSSERPDYQSVSLLSPDPNFPLELCTFSFSFFPEICQSLVDESEGRQILFSQVIDLKPKSRGKVSLRSKDPRDSPIFYTGHYSDERDLEKIVNFIEDYIGVANTTYFKSVNAELVQLKLAGCSEWEWGSREYWRCYALCMSATIYHYAGTCAVGRVVDEHLRVRGVQGLRVVDASVMPLLTSGNIQAPTIMIAEKAADYIKINAV